MLKNKHLAIVILSLIFSLTALGCAAANIDDNNTREDIGPQISTTTSSCTNKSAESTPTSTAQPSDPTIAVSGPEWSVPLTADMQDALNKAYCAHFGSEYALTWDEETHWSTRYYGTYDDCIVIFIEGQLAVKTKFELGGQTFTHPSACDFWVCFDGALYSMADAYNNKLLTDEHIQLINQYHKEYNEAYLAWMYGSNS